MGQERLGALEIPVIGTPITIPREPLVRGVAGDYWADVIIGKPDFSQIGGEEVVPFSLWNPGGVYVDNSSDHEKAYVWDAGNNRILGVDLDQCYASEKPCHASIVLGQPSLYDHSACNGDSGVQNYPHRARPSAKTLCGVPDVVGSPGETKSFVNMVTDENGNLYSPDSFNHRILLYEQPFEEDSTADEVWGQSDFAQLNCNRGSYHTPTASSLCFHSSENHNRTAARGGWPAAGVELDSAGNLWVADAGNNRVLRFPLDASSGRPRKVADLVLDQPDFNSRGYGPSLRELYSPGALRFGSGGQLYVADTYNNRVLMYEPPFVSGMYAHREIGWGFRSPNGLAADPNQRGIWVNDAGGRVISLWNWEGSEVLKVVGQEGYEPGMGGLFFRNLGDGVHFHDVGGGIAFDRNGNLLVTLSGRNQDVIRFPPPFSKPDSDTVSTPDMRFFHPPGEANVFGVKGLRNADGIALFRDQLIAADTHRLLLWNGLDTLTNGQAADGVVGDDIYKSVWPSCCENIKADDAGRLWVNSHEGSAGYIDIYQLPLTHQAAPIETFSTYDEYPILGTDEMLSIDRSRIWGIAPVAGGKFLWVTDTDHHRVLRFRDALPEKSLESLTLQAQPAPVRFIR